MNHAVFVSLVATAASLVAAAVGVRLRLAAGWGDRAPFGWAALTATLYSITNLPSTGASWVPDAAVVLATRAQLAVGALHALAWLRYAGNELGVAQPRTERWLQRLLVATALIFLLPQGGFGDRVTVHEVPWADATYRLVEQTPAGRVCVVLLSGAFALITVRYVVAWVAGRRDAGPMAAAFAVFLIFVANDALVVAGLLPTPFLIEVGLFFPLGVAAWQLQSRFIAESRELARLRDRLEARVAERTRELEGAHEILRRSERFASLGELAAGVAHEVNNPAAVVAANLGFLRERLREGDLPAEAEICIDESLQAIWRISRIVRQLLCAGRAAGEVPRLKPVAIAPIVVEAARAARVAGAHVKVESLVSDHQHVLGDEGVLVQVLSNLLVNAVQAIPGHRADGRVVVTAACRGERVSIAVDDNGAGMPDHVLRKAFEPFFSTKAPGQGTGLGLAISRGLVASLGGDLRLESAPGRGTRAVVDLRGPDRADPGLEGRASARRRAVPERSEVQ